MNRDDMPVPYEEPVTLGKGLKQAAKDVGHGFKDGAATIGTGIGGGFKTIGHGVVTAAKGVKTTVKELRKPPEMLSLADLFNRKLYDYVDFDFVLHYLRDNNIAPCIDIYTIDELVEKIIPLTKAALRDRDVKKINKAYSGIMRLCKRKHKGLLAYMSTEGHAVVCLITKWNSFFQYAGFASGVDLSNLVFRTMDVIPAWRAKKQLKAAVGVRDSDAELPSQTYAKEYYGTDGPVANTIARVEAYREAVERVDAELPRTFSSSQVSVPAGQQSFQTQTQTQKPKAQREQYCMPDISRMSFPDVTKNKTTSFFSDNDNDALYNMAKHYYDTAHNLSFQWDSEHALDTFLYFLLSRANPDLEMLTTMEDYFTRVANLFSSVGVKFDADFIYQLTGSAMLELRTVLGVPIHEFDSNSDVTYRSILNKVANRICISKMSVDATTDSGLETFCQNELAEENHYKKVAITKLNTLQLLDPTEDSVIYQRVMPSYSDLVQKHNEKVFREVYSSTANKDEDFSDDDCKALCHMIYRVTNRVDFQLNEYPEVFVTMLRTALPRWTVDINKHVADVESLRAMYCRGTVLLHDFIVGADCLKSLAIAAGIKQCVDGQVSLIADVLLKEAVANIYHTQVAEENDFAFECNRASHAEGELSTSATIDTKSAAEVLGFSRDDEKEIDYD